MAYKLRDAIGFCKDTLEINYIHDKHLKREERINFERCLTENFLVKHGANYFGKRDLIYLDLYSNKDQATLQS
jgi:hypothetical protein